MEAEYDISGNKQNKSEAGSNVHLRKYVTLAETASEPKNLIDIIRQALESPSIYVFGELLDVSNIKALVDTEYEPYLNLLNIFAFGTYQDYRKQKRDSPHKLPDLSELMIIKLRHLSIVSLARCRRHIPYQILMQELDLDNIRQLEDMIIEVIYANVIKGTMDQRNNRVEIDRTIARDVREEDFQTITNVLNEWCRTCENILSNIEHQIQTANNYKEESTRSKQALETKIQSVRKNIKQSNNDTDDAIMTDVNNVYIQDVGGQKTKRIPCRSIKSSYKSSTNKSWRREN
ncbi:COP9 signalosome complex subunit 7b-like [Dermatophagoides pteronyssinus]|uniref:COP9 signalosome complex subunit 7b-like n=1 Tax=Dermatophagoides pteronyssinus TaxID=6956 RepID=UPI003F664910